MDLIDRILALGATIATDIKGLLSKVGDLTSLDTTEKSNLVGAINEIKSGIGGGGSSDIIKVKLSDESRSGSGAPTPDGDMTVALESNSIYQLHLYLQMNLSVQGLKFEFDYPPSAQIRWDFDFDDVDENPYTETSILTISSTGSSIALGNYYGQIQTTPSGTFAFSWSGLNPTPPATLLKGSYFKLTKLV